MVLPKKPTPNNNNNAASSSTSTSSGGTNKTLLLIIKILLVLLILLWLPKLVLAASKTRTQDRTTTSVMGVEGSASRSRTGRSKSKRTTRIQKATLLVQERRLMCETDEPCASMIPEESMNCIHQCLSPICYEKVYDTESSPSNSEIVGENEEEEDQQLQQQRRRRRPLELGEIDLSRAKEFSDCIDNDMKETRRLERSAELQAKYDKKKDTDRFGAGLA